MEIENVFVPYEIALTLKELGFDEPCLAKYQKVPDGAGHKLQLLQKKINCNRLDTAISAPLYQQAFKYFRKKYNLHAEPYTTDMGAIEYCFQIRDLYSEKYVYDNFVGAGSSYAGTFSTPEEADLECLKKLIEIIKDKK
jgi:hypothetical protein